MLDDFTNMTARMPHDMTKKNTINKKVKTLKKKKHLIGKNAKLLKAGRYNAGSDAGSDTAEKGFYSLFLFYAIIAAPKAKKRISFGAVEIRRKDEFDGSTPTSTFEKADLKSILKSGATPQKSGATPQKTQLAVQHDKPAKQISDQSDEYKDHKKRLKLQVSRKIKVCQFICANCFTIVIGAIGRSTGQGATYIHSQIARQSSTILRFGEKVQDTMGGDS
jgi:hypothetical protein